MEPEGFRFLRKSLTRPAQRGDDDDVGEAGTGTATGWGDEVVVEGMAGAQDALAAYNGKVWYGNRFGRTAHAAFSAES